MDAVDFTDLLSIGIKTHERDASMRKSAGSLQAKYKKPVLRKSKILRMFKKY